MIKAGKKINFIIICQIKIVKMKTMEMLKFRLQYDFDVHVEYYKK